MTLPLLLDAWNTFFHAEVSCATLVIFRIAIGFLLMANVLLLLQLVSIHLRNASILSRGDTLLRLLILFTCPRYRSTSHQL